MLDWSECPAVERVPGRVGGAWLFKGTRVPVRALFENLESRARGDEFVEWFPGVARERVEAVLEHAERSLAVAWSTPPGHQLLGAVSVFAELPRAAPGLVRTEHPVRIVLDRRPLI